MYTRQKAYRLREMINDYELERLRGRSSVNNANDQRDDKQVQRILRDAKKRHTRENGLRRFLRPGHYKKIVQLRYSHWGSYESTGLSYKWIG